MKVYVVSEYYWKDLDGYYSSTEKRVIKVFKNKEDAEKYKDDWNSKFGIYQDPDCRYEQDEVYYFVEEFELEEKPIFEVTKNGN